MDASCHHLSSANSSRPSFPPRALSMWEVQRGPHLLDEVVVFPDLRLLGRFLLCVALALPVAAAAVLNKVPFGGTSLVVVVASVRRIRFTQVSPTRRCHLRWRGGGEAERGRLAPTAEHGFP